MMKNFNELSKDILVAMDSLDYETKEENLLKSELIINIGRFLSDEESYRENLNILSNTKNVASEDSYYSDEVFNKVATDIVVSIGSLEYQDIDMKMLKVELLLNISRFLNTQKDYYRNISVLNEFVKSESVLKYK